MIPPHPRSSRGFTLIETAMATVIVGVGLMAGMQLFATCAQQNHAAAEMSVAMMLTSNIQEAMGAMNFADPGTGYARFGAEAGESLATYDDIDDFDGQTFSPPIDSLRDAIPEMGQYSQVVSVWPVYPNKLSVNSNESSPDIPKSGTFPNFTAPYTGAVRVRVRVLFAATPTSVPEEVYRASWVRMDN